MKPLIIAFAIAFGPLAAAALADGDEHHAGKEKNHGKGHADTVGKPGTPGKVSRTIDVEMRSEEHTSELQSQ